MAANWRHLARFAGRRWIPAMCRARPILPEATDPVLRTGVPSATITSSWSLQCRAASSADTVEAPPGLLTRFWRWFNDDVEEEAMTDEEATERQALLQKVQDMYFAKPPITPGLDFYKEAFSMLMKYNDGLGVQTLWNSMREMQVEPDEELTSKVVPFLEESRRRAWFE